MPNMKFCVYLTVYRGTQLPKRYVGSSSVERVLSGYNGTVKSKRYKAIFKAEQEHNKQLFKTRILSYHQTRKEALEAELALQLKFDVVNSDTYMNMGYASPNGHFGVSLCGDKHPMYGKHHTEQSRQQLSLSSKKAYAEGRSITPFASLDITGENNPFYGKTHKAKSIELMKKPKRFVPKWICPHCDKPYDGGNLDQHLKRTLGWTKDETATYRTTHQPTNLQS
jgi:hypothetical protein